jgi:CRP-like cAMP-binding protein
MTATTPLLRAALADSPLFAGLTAEQILQLGPERQTLAEGSTLFRRGEPGPCAFLVLSGILWPATYRDPSSRAMV